MDERVTELVATFSSCLTAFDTANLFTGPSLYFYLKTLGVRARHATAVAALTDDEFFDGLYATLTAWGMHRMGPGHAKLAELPDVKESFRRQADRIRGVESFDISTLSPTALISVVDRLWDLMSRLRVGIGKTQIVSNSKALHLLLPALMPPIDREYTARFFYNHKTLNLGDERTFREIYPHFHRIATSCGDPIRRRVEVGARMDTCATKVIDNAIVGYVRMHLPKRSASE